MAVCHCLATGNGPDGTPTEQRDLEFPMLRFLNDENGATAIEYGLIAALIAVVIIGAVSALGTSVSSTFDTISGALSSATSSVGTAS